MPTRAMLCFPPAGAGASFFHPWIGRHDDLRVLPVQLPGREKRLMEPEFTELGPLIDAIVPELSVIVREFDKVAVFGHSFGALLAYRCVRELAKAVPGTALSLVASGSPAPDRPRSERIARLPDDRFLAALERVAGYHHPALDVPELRELLLPAFRTDVRMHEDYEFVPDPDGRPPLDVPVVAVRGAADHLVSAADLGGWRRMTSGSCEPAEVGGGHMYLVDAPEALLDLVAGVLR